MMSRHFRLSSELTGAKSKRLQHAKNQLSGHDNFFNQFVTDIYIPGYYTALQRYAPNLKSLNFHTPYSINCIIK